MDYQKNYDFSLYGKILGR